MTTSTTVAAAPARGDFTTIGLIGLSEFANRLVFTGTDLVRIEPMPLLDVAGALGLGIDAAEAAIRAAVPTARYIFLEPDLDRGVGA